MSLEDIKKLLKEEHNIDLDQLQAQVEAAAQTPQESGASNEEAEAQATALGSIAEALNLSNATPAEVAETVTARVADLSARIDKLESATAEAEVEELIRVGRVLPKQKDIMIHLARSDRKSFDALVPDEPIVDLSERGVETHSETQSENFDDEIARLAAMATQA